jgi:hypothetical protein
LKKFIAVAFILSSVFVAPGLMVTGASAETCGPGVPEAWTRPGGFCDQLEGGSLSHPNAGCSSYEYVFPVSFGRMVPGARVNVAEACIIDCSVYDASVDVRSMHEGDRARVAEIPAGCQD